MKSKSFIKNLFLIAFPIILQDFLSSFVNMLDTIMVGQLGAVDIAAVGLGNQLFFIMSLGVFGIASGGQIFIAQYWGKKDIDKIHKTTGMMLQLSLGFTLLFAFVSMAFPEFCLSIYSNDEEVIKRGAEYLRVVAPSYIFFGLNVSFAVSARNTEHLKLPAVATITSVFLNALLNYLFIFGVNIGGVQIIKAYGIIGAAVATVISRIVEAVIVVGGSYLRKYVTAARIKDYIVKDKAFLAHYAKISLPVLANELLWGCGISMQSSIFAHSGTLVIASFNIMNSISNLVYPICLGCGNATAIIIGKTIGEGKTEEAKTLAKKQCGFIAAMAFCLGFVIMPLSKLMPFVFNVEEEVLAMATVFIIMRGLIFSFDAFNMTSVVGVFRSGGDTVFALFMDVGFMWLLSLPLGWLAVLVWKLPFWGVYLCILTEPVCKAIVGIIRLRSNKWLRKL
ncbi:MAG: MATE family efflux transporter [Treponema sp.]|nr:MATE family efflux transporter [Treponema sp.]